MTSIIDDSKKNKAIYKLVGDLFAISASYKSEENIILSLLPRYNKKDSLIILKDRLKLAGYKYSINESDEFISLTINPKATFRIPPLNIFLFFTTLFTIYIIPVFYKNASGSIFILNIEKIIQYLILNLDKTIQALKKRSRN